MGYLNSSLNIESAAIASATLIIFGSLATSMAMFVMVVTRTEHPPAAALALGLVLVLLAGAINGFLTWMQLRNARYE